MSTKFLVGAAVAVVLLAVLGAWYFAVPTHSEILSYEDCIAAGYPSLETYPEQCRLPDGRNFVRNVEPVPQATTTIPGPAASSSSPKPAGAAFGTPITFRIGQTVTFEDGLSLTLQGIGDSRCKPGVQCIWAGELNPTFVAKKNGVTQEIHLGSSRTTSANWLNYQLRLDNATTSNATIVVTK